MTTPDQRDRAMDALLRRPLSGEAEPSDACLDAETLAAWMDGGLDAHTLAQVEAHAAGCARCQALMATLVKSDPAPEVAAGEPWWNRWSLRWLVPLTAAAAATVVWMLVPGSAPQTSRVEPDSTQARANSSVPAGPAAAVAPPPPAAREQPAPAAPPPEALGKVAPAPAATAVKPSPAAPAAADTPAEAPAAIAGAPTVLADARQEAAKQAAAEAPSVLNETVGGERRSAEAAAPPTINSRDPSVRWRLAGPGVVERSTDSGASWSRLETGVVAALTAGASPSASVCWVVGPRGLVLVTTDARAWRRVTSPTTDDLVAVDATDAGTATVRAATGAAFRTTDGGASWVATP